MKPQSPFHILFFLFLVFLPSSEGFALQATSLNQGVMPLGVHFEYLADESKNLTIAEVASPEWDKKFTKSEQKILNFGRTSSAYWVRFTVEADPKSNSKWLIETKTNVWNLVQFHFKNDHGEWIKEEGGRDLAFDPALFMNGNVQFQLPPLKGLNEQFYLRFQSDTYRMMSVQALIIDSSLWSLGRYQSELTWAFYLRGIFYGFMIIMIVYNFLLFTSIRDISYLYYTLYLSALVPFFMIFDGIWVEHFWSTAEILLEAKLITVSFSAFSLFFVLFVKSFLKTKQNSPKLDLVLSLSLGVNVLGAMLVSFLPYLSISLTEISAANTFLMFTLILIVAVLTFKNGYQPAKYFLLASGSFLGGGAVATLSTFQTFSFLAESSIGIIKTGAVLEAILYSFALAERFKFERRQKEESQELAIANLQRSNQIKDEFLANTSHELRTPLHGIIGLAEATLESLKGAESLKDSQSLNKQQTTLFQSNLSLIVSSGRRLSLLVNDILDLSKLKHKELPLNLQPVDLGRLVESVCALSQVLIGDKPIKLVNEIEKTQQLPPLMADEARLEQILYNIIGNAIKFTEVGSVTIKAVQIDQRIEVSVSDTGIGIAPEEESKIFNAFEQLDGSTTRLHEGTGLGLAIVKNLVELHGSRLEVESTVGKGSVFSFGLAIATALEDHGQSDITKPVRDVKPPTFAPLAQLEVKGFLDILIVDDDPLNIEVITQQLSAKDYQLQVASNGEAALKAVAEKKPDLILLDVMMPKMSGFDVCELLRAKYNQNQLPIIFLTAKNREVDVLRGLEIGGNDYLTKPFFRSELIQRVENQLEIAQYQKHSDSLQSFANKISQYASQEEMISEAFGQIAQSSLVDEAVWFEAEQLLFSFCLGPDTKGFLEQAPTAELFKQIKLQKDSPQALIFNNVTAFEPLGLHYQEGHFLFICPQHLPDQLIVLYRKLERKPFDESKAAVYAQSMINQIQTTQKNLEALFGDDKLVSVIGKVQPRLHEITHIKSASPTLEVYFDSDKRPEYIDGCSLDKLSLYFNEGHLLRVHKSYLVNLAKVTALHKTAKSRDLNLELTSGEIIPAGRTYMEKIRQIFPQLSK